MAALGTIKVLVLTEPLAFPPITKALTIGWFDYELHSTGAKVSDIFRELQCEYGFVHFKWTMCQTQPSAEQGGRAQTRWPGDSIGQISNIAFWVTPLPALIEEARAEERARSVTLHLCAHEEESGEDFFFSKVTLKIPSFRPITWSSWLRTLQDEEDEIISNWYSPGELRKFPRLELQSYEGEVTAGSYQLTLYRRENSVASMSDEGMSDELSE
jgi:hypothetical protein